MTRYRQGDKVTLKDGSVVYYDRGGYQRTLAWVGHWAPVAFSGPGWSDLA